MFFMMTGHSLVLMYQICLNHAIHDLDEDLFFSTPR